MKGKRIIVNFKTLPKSLKMEMRLTQLTSNKSKYKIKIILFLLYLPYMFFLVAIPLEYCNICKKHHILLREAYENVALTSMLIPKTCGASYGPTNI